MGNRERGQRWVLMLLRGPEAQSELRGHPTAVTRVQYVLVHMEPFDRG